MWHFATKLSTNRKRHLRVMMKISTRITMSSAELGISLSET